MTTPHLPLTFFIYENGDYVREVTIVKSVIKVGKLRTMNLQFDDDSISRMHALIEVTGPGDVSIVDLNSTAGTFVNGQKVSKIKLARYDRIEFGKKWAAVIVWPVDKAKADPTPASATDAASPPEPPPVHTNVMDAIDEAFPVLVYAVRRTVNDLADKVSQLEKRDLEWRHRTGCAGPADPVTVPTTSAAHPSPAPDPAPIPMRLHCPECHALHIDEGEFATKPHRNHTCQACGLTWRPAAVATVGVQFLAGTRNEAPTPPLVHPPWTDADQDDLERNMEALRPKPLTVDHVIDTRVIEFVDRHGHWWQAALDGRFQRGRAKGGGWAGWHPAVMTPMDRACSCRLVPCDQADADPETRGPIAPSADQPSEAPTGEPKKPPSKTGGSSGYMFPGGGGDPRGRL